MYVKLTEVGTGVGQCMAARGARVAALQRECEAGAVDLLGVTRWRASCPLSLQLQKEEGGMVHADLHHGAP